MTSNQYDSVRHQPASVWWLPDISNEIGASLGAVLSCLEQNAGELGLIALVGCFMGYGLFYSL
jgi:hypothetical protein